MGKREQVQQACTQCRKRTYPCTNCTKRNLDCQFVHFEQFQVSFVPFAETEAGTKTTDSTANLKPFSHWNSLRHPSQIEGTRLPSDSSLSGFAGEDARLIDPILETTIEATGERTATLTQSEEGGKDKSKTSPNPQPKPKLYPIPPIHVAHIPQDNAYHEPFFDFSTPFLLIGDEKFMYLDVYKRFINPYQLLFGQDMSFFGYFPFRGPAIYEALKKTASTVLRSLNLQPNSLYEDFVLFYFDALHVQFYAIIAQAAHFLGHFWVSVMCMKQARLYHAVLQDQVGNISLHKHNIFQRIREPLAVINEIGKTMWNLAYSGLAPDSEEMNALYKEYRESWTSLDGPPLHDPLPLTVLMEEPAPFQLILHLLLSAVAAIGLPLNPSEVMEGCMFLEFVKGGTLLALFYSTQSDQRSSHLAALIHDIKDGPYLYNLQTNEWSPFHWVLHHPSTVPPFHPSFISIFKNTEKLLTTSKNLQGLHDRWKKNGRKTPECDIELEKELSRSVLDIVNESTSHLVSQKEAVDISMDDRSVMDSLFSQTRSVLHFLTFVSRVINRYSCNLCHPQNPPSATATPPPNPSPPSVFQHVFGHTEFLHCSYAATFQSERDGMRDLHTMGLNHVDTQTTRGLFDVHVSGLNEESGRDGERSPMLDVFHFILKHTQPRPPSSQHAASSSSYNRHSLALLDYSLRQLQFSDLVFWKGKHEPALATRLMFIDSAVNFMKRAFMSLYQQLAAVWLITGHLSLDRNVFCDDHLVSYLEALREYAELFVVGDVKREGVIIVVCEEREGGNDENESGEMKTDEHTSSVSQSNNQIIPLTIVVQDKLRKPCLVIADPRSPHYPFVDTTAIPKSLRVVTDFLLFVPTPFDASADKSSSSPLPSSPPSLATLHNPSRYPHRTPSISEFPKSLQPLLSAHQLQLDLLILPHTMFTSSPSQHRNDCEQVHLEELTQREWMDTHPPLLRFMSGIVSEEAVGSPQTAGMKITKTLSGFFEDIKRKRGEQKEEAKQETSATSTPSLQSTPHSTPTSSSSLPPGFSTAQPTLPPMSVLLPFLVKIGTEPQQATYSMPFSFTPAALCSPSLDPTIRAHMISYLSHAAIALTACGFLELSLILANEAMKQIRLVVEREGVLVLLTKPSMMQSLSSCSVVYRGVLVMMDEELQKQGRTEEEGDDETVSGSSHNSSKVFSDPKYASTDTNPLSSLFPKPPTKERKKFRVATHIEVVEEAFACSLFLIQILRFVELHTSSRTSVERMTLLFRHFFGKMTLEDVDKLKKEESETIGLEPDLEIDSELQVSPLVSFLTPTFVRTIVFYLKHHSLFPTFHSFFPSEPYSSLIFDRSSPVTIHTSTVEAFVSSRNERLRMFLGMDGRGAGKKREVLSIRLSPNVTRVVEADKESWKQKRDDEPDGQNEEGGKEMKGEGKVKRAYHSFRKKQSQHNQNPPITSTTSLRFQQTHSPSLPFPTLTPSLSERASGHPNGMEGPQEQCRSERKMFETAGPQSIAHLSLGGPLGSDPATLLPSQRRLSFSSPHSTTTQPIPHSLFSETPKLQSSSGGQPLFTPQTLSLHEPQPNTLTLSPSLPHSHPHSHPMNSPDFLSFDDYSMFSMDENARLSHFVTMNPIPAAEMEWSGRADKELMGMDGMQTGLGTNELRMPFSYSFDDAIDSFLFDTSI
ncbi:hypothetical protein BLNAU_19003 [Blattamonas nauphoetae]|uniref:Zn(2)-C6 fungal-type domain-containing protein n=1 Tax=Blattamonas nauphoetae TaxID=2049346 RepID=A0ABQ9X309_9EUKA|nr:hypothetical protein BLNAU_19003 [Blattamonas nauphoetae]